MAAGLVHGDGGTEYFQKEKRAEHRHTLGSGAPGAAQAETHVAREEIRLTGRRKEGGQSLNVARAGSPCELPGELTATFPLRGTGAVAGVRRCSAAQTEGTTNQEFLSRIKCES